MNLVDGDIVKGERTPLGPADMPATAANNTPEQKGMSIPMGEKDIKRTLSGGAIVCCIVLFCAVNLSGENYRAQMITYTISGSVGLSGVTMYGLPGGPVVTDQAGNYAVTVNYGWAGTVAPRKEGYIFEPASRTYTKVTSNQDNQDYTAALITFTVSGTVGMEAVVMTGLPGNPVSDRDGRYGATVDYGWSGTVTPTKEGYTFNPANRVYANLTADRTNQGFTSALITFTISGKAGMPGVTMKGLPGNPVAGAGGLYSATVEYGWSGMVEPTKEGYTFNPPERQYLEVTAGQLNQDYAPAVLTYIIAGNSGAAGVVMNGLPGNPISGPDGTYTISVDYGWSGTVTPTRPGYTFEPPKRVYNRVTADSPDHSYAATLMTFTISGTTGMPGVTMAGLPGDPVTDAKGTYTVTVDYGFSGTVTPMLEGYSFKPTNRVYANVTAGQANQTYTPSRITYTVSGSVGIAGVVMNGLPGNPVTGQGGLYSATVEYGWSGTVTPVKEGYTFEPDKRIYNDVTQAQANQSYTSTLLTYTISGSAQGLPGVIMEGLPGNPITDANGFYSAVADYGWSGTVRPVREGYTFEPAKREYAAVTADHPDDGYTPAVITFTVSGTAGAEGVVLNGLPGNPVTGKAGVYSTTVEYGWSGTVMPTREGYTFEPTNRVYASVTGPQANQNYTPALITFTISGTAGAEGVVLNGLPGNPISGKGGLYTATVQYGWKGTVTPTKQGYIFTPPTRMYDDVLGSEANQNYAPTLLTFTISGTVVSRDGPVEGVLVSAGQGGGSGVTDAEGKYELLVDYGWSGAVAPAKEGYTFKPANMQYTPVSVDQVNQSYTGTLLTYVISGAITINGQPVEGVLVSAEPGGGSDITDTQGKYSVTVPHGWSGTVTPTKEGYVFDPPSTTYTNVTSDVSDRLKPPPPRQVPIQPVPHVTEVEPVVPTIPPAPVEPSIAMPIPPAVEPNVAVTAVEPKIAIAPPEPNVFEGTLVSNVFVDTDLRTALQDLASQAGITIIPDETVAGTVTCEFSDVSLEKALEIILAGTAFVVKRTPDYYLVCSADPKSAAFPVVSESRVMKLNYVKADTAVTLLSSPFRSYVAADADAGTVSITAPHALMERIVSDLKLIDRRPMHVMLDARIVVMERTDLLNLGIKWDWSQIKVGTFSDDAHQGSGRTGVRWPWGVQIGYTSGREFTDKLLLTLNLLEQNGEVSVVASPQVLAQDGKEAEIKVSTEEYFSMILEGYWYPRAELEKVESGTVLNITPRIGGNNDITLAMSIEVSDVVARSADNFPVITRRTTKNTVRIKDGGTVAVAGLTEDRRRSERGQTPGIGNIPVIGELFRTRTGDSASREVAIFITAHLVPEMESDLVELAEPPADSTPIQPVGDEFKAALEQALSHSSG